MPEMIKVDAFREELQALINRLGLDGLSDTPDFILAQFLAAGFEAYRAAVNRRDDHAKGELRFVCDGPPGPEAGRFVETEDENGNGIRAGEWVERNDGRWELRVRYTGSLMPPVSPAGDMALKKD